MGIFYNESNSIIKGNMKYIKLIKEYLKEKFTLNKDSNIISEADWSKFKEELDLYVSKMGFEETYFELMQDAIVTERMFYIKSPENKNFDELTPYLDDIVKHMKSFCEENNLRSLYMDSYIIFD